MTSSLTLWLGVASPVLLGLSGLLYSRYRNARRHHALCVQLCHRIADELSRRQDEELVVDRVFDVIISHTRAVIGILLWRGEREQAPLRVLRVRGLDPSLLSPGTELPIAARGFGFGELPVSGDGEIIHEGLRQAVQAYAGIRLSPRQNMMCIPVTAPPATHGLIQLVSSAEFPYTRQTLADVCGMGVYLDAAIQNAQKVETIRRQRDAAEALYKIGLTISRSLDIDEILADAVTDTRRLMRSTFTVYMDCPMGRGSLATVRRAAGTHGPTFAPGARIPLGERVLQMLNHDGTALRHNYIRMGDLTRDPGEGPADVPISNRETRCFSQAVQGTLASMGIHSIVLTAVGVGERARGVLGNFSDRVDFYDAFHVQLQQRIANQLLIALNTADYHLKAKRLALSEERRRMSDDLHDNMAQVINGLSLELHSLIKRADRERASATLLERMHSIRARLEESKATIREAIFELQIPEDRGFWSNLRDFATRFEQWHGFPVQVELPSREITLAPQRQREVLRIAQEALWNARRHSGSDAASLRGEYGEHGSLRIDVEDRGQGYAENALDSGQGIATMRNRARRLGGSLEVTNIAPHGVRVRLEFPLHES